MESSGPPEAGESVPTLLAEPLAPPTGPEEEQIEDVEPLDGRNGIPLWLAGLALGASAGALAPVERAIYIFAPGAFESLGMVATEAEVSLGDAGTTSQPTVACGVVADNRPSGSRRHAKRVSRPARASPPAGSRDSRGPWDPRAPLAPTVASALVGGSANSGSGLPGLAALAPASTPVRPDLGRKLVGQDAAGWPATFVSLLERPG